MRFETDVLTLDPKPLATRRFFRETPADISNKACIEEIREHGWVIPGRTGARIVLVFSTDPVRGASRCRGTDLVFAGAMAMREAGAYHYHGFLWWWPCIVTGPGE